MLLLQHLDFDELAVIQVFLLLQPLFGFLALNLILLQELAELDQLHLDIHIPFPDVLFDVFKVLLVPIDSDAEYFRYSSFCFSNASCTSYMFRRFSSNFVAGDILSYWWCGTTVTFLALSFEVINNNARLSVSSSQESETRLRNCNSEIIAMINNDSQLRRLARLIEIKEQASKLLAPYITMIGIVDGKNQYEVPHHNEKSTEFVEADIHGAISPLKPLHRNQMLSPVKLRRLLQKPSVSMQR